ncbi:hypothetical protein LEP1GSC050_2648 [Leptospira broomii serovar Hurstbridge str. 5399]|uniref:Uncharacterized protein n=1 Tax=Leptospira broomii serovar Hurstbridge str. 5399 TaxID=1049789 RepID=T0EZL8_9LEPT|nr:hypothetical protein LEP1GSC050_2648 [Leptospira broomii serovar Hurstbridge str. 5399]
MHPTDFVYRGDLEGLRKSLSDGHSVNSPDPFMQNYRL